MTDHVLSWAAPNEPRFELVEVSRHLETLSARGTMLAGGPDPYRVDYHLDTGPGYVTKRLTVSAAARTWTRQLRISRDAEGEWTIRRTASPADKVELVEPDELADAMDCDLRFSPLMNTMPILRHNLHQNGGHHRVVTALVTLPDLGVLRSEQAYQHLWPTDGGSMVQHSAGDESVDVALGSDGFVTHYPGVAIRVGPSTVPSLSAR